MAASATFALNAELCVRRARLAIVTPDLRHSRRLQAEAPLIDLSEFGQPALNARFLEVDKTSAQLPRWMLRLMVTSPLLVLGCMRNATLAVAETGEAKRKGSDAA